MTELTVDRRLSAWVELRKSLNDLCYSIFDILENPELNIIDEHKKEFMYISVLDYIDFLCALSFIGNTSNSQLNKHFD